MFNRRTVIVALAATVAVKIAMSCVPDGFVRVAFCLPPARAAAFYYGVPLYTEPVGFVARGVAMEVTRECAATDFFSIVCGLLAAKVLLSGKLRAAAKAAAAVAAVPAAYLCTIAANSLRLVALVPVDAALPRSSVPVVHLVAGAAVFLGVLVLLCMILKFDTPSAKGEPHER